MICQNVSHWKFAREALVLTGELWSRLGFPDGWNYSWGYEARQFPGRGIEIRLRPWEWGYGRRVKSGAIEGWLETGVMEPLAASDCPEMDGLCVAQDGASDGECRSLTKSDEERLIVEARDASRCWSSAGEWREERGIKYRNLSVEGHCKGVSKGAPERLSRYSTVTWGRLSNFLRSPWKAGEIVAYGGEDCLVLVSSWGRGNAHTPDGHVLWLLPNKDAAQFSSRCEGGEV